MNPLPWYIAGPAIAIIMFCLMYFGRLFGVSKNLETICTMAGAGKFSSYFDTNWKDNSWSLIFIFGALIGGFLAANFLATGFGEISNDTIEALTQNGFSNIGNDYLPPEIFSATTLFSLKGLLVLIGAGFLIGFGTRYAGGCTSGHAISGMSNLQVGSLVAVIGFFIGGLLMTHFLMPLIF